MMLIAKSETNEYVNLAEKEKEIIEGLKKKKWFCPGCEEEVIIKNGTIMCSHFAHKNKCDCHIFSENESKEHLNGKKIIAESCRKFGVPYEIEAFLPELNQRPDVLINKQIAIEFQCSSLKIERFKERTENYQRHGYQVVWLLGKKLHLKNKPSSLQKQFLYLSQNIGFYVWELEVIEKKLRILYFLNNTPLGEIRQQKEWLLLEESLLNLLSYPQKSRDTSVYEMCSEVNFFKQKGIWNHQLNQKQKNIMELQDYFYSKGLNLRELPCVYFFPSYQSLILVEKEFILRHLVFAYLEREQRVTKHDLYHYVNNEISNYLSLDYSLIGRKQLIKYHVSVYLCFLKQSRVIGLEENQYVFKKNELDISNFEKEFLGIPLKYVMINK
ncbi:MAG: competence protein CoiA family protein [Vagococcus sp.]|uniref:competence protein CoiA n=1 Tax=Vagococcus sp. TaxID=1933889 RepID=UPI002FC6EA2E